MIARWSEGKENYITLSSLSLLCGQGVRCGSEYYYEFRCDMERRDKSLYPRRKLPCPWNLCHRGPRSVIMAGSNRGLITYVRFDYVIRFCYVAVDAAADQGSRTASASIRFAIHGVARDDERLRTRNASAISRATLNALREIDDDYAAGKAAGRARNARLIRFRDFLTRNYGRK